MGMLLKLEMRRVEMMDTWGTILNSSSQDFEKPETQPLGLHGHTRQLTRKP